MLGLWVVEQAEPEAHVDAVDLLGAADGEAAEPVVFARLAFDVVLGEMLAWDSLCESESVPTPMGFAAVRTPRERSLKVSDMVDVLYGPRPKPSDRSWGVQVIVYNSL